MSGATDPLVFLAEYIAEVNGVSPGNNPQQMAEFVSLMAPKMISDTVGVLRQWRKITKILNSGWSMTWNGLPFLSFVLLPRS